MKTYPLDKILIAGNDYVMEGKRGYVIREVATDSATKGVLKVEGAPVLEVVKDICPLYPTLTNSNPALDLGDYFVVVEPNEKLRFEGDSGSKIRIVGEIFELETGEAVPGGLHLRHDEQTGKYLTYFSGDVTADAGETVSQYTEVFPIDTEIGAGRKYVLLGGYQAEARLDNLVNVPDFYSRVYINDDPQDILSRNAGPYGIDGRSAPNPPRFTDATADPGAAVDVEKIRYQLELGKMELIPGDRFKVGIINEGADYTVPTGRTLSRIVHVIVGYIKVK
jgi:hypothetical protein